MSATFGVFMTFSELSETFQFRLLGFDDHTFRKILFAHRLECLLAVLKHCLYLETFQLILFGGFHMCSALSSALERFRDCVGLGTISGL